jgi:RimJ/RimL family protein N-acetyltransferase
MAPTHRARWSRAENARLLLRAWRPEDREPFARINADPEVMEYFVSPMARHESDASMDRIEAGIAEHGFGLWAVEERETAAFIGFAGLSDQTFESPFTPAFEVGYRLARQSWGQGYATEAAKEAVRYGFAEVGLREIVSITAVGNARSRAVMEKLGMTRNPADDFDHPGAPDGHPLRRHVLYRLTDAQWQAAAR